MPEDGRLSQVGSVGEFFKSEVDQAVANQNLETSEEVTFYLVQLLEQLATPDGARVMLDEPLALLLNRAVFSNQSTRASAFRVLGDVSLCVAGLFSASLRRRCVDVGYAIGMGSGAYSVLSDLSGGARALSRGQVLHVLYAEMSDKFAHLVEVLTQISERTLLGADSPDLAELYERWARTRGPHLMSRLRGLGAFPGRG